MYYAPTLVTYSMPCFEETRTPKVGMRLAMLHPLGEFHGAIPEARFYPGRITKVEEVNGDDHMVTMEFDGPSLPATKSMTFGWDYFAKFCVPLPAQLKRLMRKPL